ncbi:MAG: amidohydrolase family protein [Acidobacteria bacterium]|nr:amidohydrolase family protein [Acidobacteriota bacterium]
MRIDSHQHFWKYNPTEYGWMQEGMESLRRDYLPGDLAPLLAADGIDGTVAVQARQTAEESRWLLELADQNPFIKGVVGWVDLCHPKVEQQLERFARHPKFRGVRHIVHDEPDDRFLMRRAFVDGIGCLAQFGLTYDLLLFPRHLPVACELVRLFPEQPFVLDHIAKPPIKDHTPEPWAADIRRLARFPNVYCKISGMVTEADWRGWKPADFTPYLEVVFECFGTKRLMVGSDWPVCTLAASYSAVMQIVAKHFSQLSHDERAAIWGGNAKSFYRLPN